jgi:two-component system, cell cycle sensor histidine kinase and response regulator CckA
LFEQERKLEKHMCHYLKCTPGNWDLQGILLVSLLLISCAYAVLESFMFPNIPFCQSKTLTILIAVTGVAVTSVLIRKYSELHQSHERKAQRLRAKIKELNEKLGNVDEADEDENIATDMMEVKKKEWGKIFDSIHDWVCLMDLNSVILRTNRVGEKYTGLPVKEIIGRKCCQLVHGTDSPLDECPLFKMLKTGERECVELQFKDGRWMLITVDPIFNEKGEMIKAVHITRDITNRKREEKEKAKLEVLSRQLQKADSLGRMAGAIAHHFNNQLAVVMGNLELAIADMPQGKKLSENLTAAIQATRRASNVSGLMLTYLGQTPDKHEPLDLSEVCRQNLPLFRAAIPHQLVLETDLPSPGPRIRANKNQIEQALTNMIKNAWESCEGRGTISIGIKTVPAESIPTSNRFPVDWQPQGIAYAGLEVRDTGCGIVEKDIERIFDPFFSSKFPGRGLGLPVVLGIARAHCAAVAVESEPGRGSLFRIFLPLWDGKETLLIQRSRSKSATSADSGEDRGQKKQS